MLINPNDFYSQLAKNDIDFFTGVPDSLLKDICLCIDDKVSKSNHIISANEGNAVALAAGYHLATNKLPLVYMQNSGLGNAINPLLSLCDLDVYSIPILLMIGWRGQPEIKDEPQHIKQGRIQLELLETLGIPYEIISSNTSQSLDVVNKAICKAKKLMSPVALLVEKGTFEFYKGNNQYLSDNLKREDALKIILEEFKSDEIIISTTGKTSRELFEIRKNKKQSHEKDFLTVGSMGHSSSIALGIAIAKPNRKVVCIDGDGAMLMHLGSLATISSLNPKNYYHILMNNGVHESVGGQNTAAKQVDLLSVAESIGYKKILSVKSSKELEKDLNNFINGTGPSFMEVIIDPGSRADLGRPTIKPKTNKNSFMKFLNN